MANQPPLTRRHNSLSKMSLLNSAKKPAEPITGQQAGTKLRLIILKLWKLDIQRPKDSTAPDLTKDETLRPRGRL